MCPENQFLTALVIKEIKEIYPSISIYLWTGYTIEELTSLRKIQNHLDYILNNINVLIDGKYENDKRDITLELRGSSNQRIFDFTKKI